MIYIDASAAVHNKAGLSRYAQELIATLVADPAYRGEYTVFYNDASTAQPNAVIRSLAGISTTQSSRPWRMRALLAQLANVSLDDMLDGAGTGAVAAPRLLLIPRRTYVHGCWVSDASSPMPACAAISAHGGRARHLASRGWMQSIRRAQYMRIY